MRHSIHTLLTPLVVSGDIDKIYPSPSDSINQGNSIVILDVSTTLVSNGFGNGWRSNNIVRLVYLVAKNQKISESTYQLTLGKKMLIGQYLLDNQEFTLAPADGGYQVILLGEVDISEGQFESSGGGTTYAAIFFDINYVYMLGGQPNC